MEAVAMDEHNENIDHDILKGKEDILRARKKAAEKQPSPKQENPDQLCDTNASAGKQDAPQEPTPIMKAVVDANKQKRNRSDATDVPMFDVSRQILARQRQVAAAKRTAPVKHNAPSPVSSINVPIRKDQIECNKPGYNSLIAEIVARDINMFCLGCPVTR